MESSGGLCDLCVLCGFFLPKMREGCRELVDVLAVLAARGSADELLHVAARGGELAAPARMIGEGSAAWS